MPLVNGSSSSLMEVMDWDGIHLMWPILGFKLISVSFKKSHRNNNANVRSSELKPDK